MTDQDRLDQLCSNTLRTLAMDAVQKANSGHPGMPMGMATSGYVLWTQFLRHNPSNPDWENRDRFVLSAGHGCMLLYGLLHLTGYDLSLEDIKQFRQLGSKTPGHPESHLVPAIETTTGPLGQGFAVGVGLAIGEKFFAARYNRPGFDIVDYRVYAIVSDGDLMEGVASEAASLAGHLRLGNLIYLYDDNHISIEGNTEITFTEDTARRFEAYGWHVQVLPDGNDAGAIAGAIRKAREVTDRPSLIKIRTHIAYGSPNKQDNAEAHGAPLGEDEVRLTKKNLGWDPDKQFYVPEEALSRFREAIPNGKKSESEWNELFDRYSKAFPDLAREWKQVKSRKYGDAWKEAIPSFSPAEGDIATRQASGKVLNAIAPHLPALIGGSADLAPSTNTLTKGGGDFEPASETGRNFHFGVREHAMGSVLNGLAHTRGIIPYGATFLIFSDYMRPAIRLAALMGIRPIYVFTHDSIGLGEDGPTHQPIEQLASLRSVINLKVIRPADPNETAQAWKIAIEQMDGPVAIVLTRQKVPTIDQGKYAPAHNLSRGGYVLSEAPNGAPEAILIGTGSEVQLALKAQELLGKSGIQARVVSMPCTELFDMQPDEYKESVLPSSITARVAVEAGVKFGWERYIGALGEFVGMSGYGASGPGADVMKHFGFTAEHVVERTKASLSRQPAISLVPQREN
jgi:transketolase